jgi:hypothetical protein
MKKRKTERKNIVEYRPWSEEEIRIVRRTYPSAGNAATQAALARAGYERTSDAINSRAQLEGLLYQMTIERRGDYVRLVMVEPIKTGDESRVSKRALRAAKRDGVILRDNVPPYPYLVPADWADKYVEEMAWYDMEARHKLATWWRNHRVAKEFDITADHLTVAKRTNTPLGKAIKSIPHKVYELHNENRHTHEGTVTGIRVLLWEPTAAVRAAAKYLDWLRNSPEAEWARFAKMREAIKKILREEARESEE